MRRPRKINTAPAASEDATMTTTGGTRRRPRGSVPAATRYNPIIYPPSDSDGTYSDSDSDSNGEEDIDSLNITIMDRAPEATEGDDELAMQVPRQEAGFDRAAIIARAEARLYAAAAAGRAAGIPIDRTITTTTTSSAAPGSGRGGDEAPNGLTPTERLREIERGSLFGFDEPSPSFAELLDNISTGALFRPPLSEPTLSSRNPHDPLFPLSSAHAQLLFPTLPTDQEIWSVVTDDEEPFPHESISSFESLLDRLNATSAISSSSTSNGLLRAIDHWGLLAELTMRDVSIPIRLRNAMSRRRSTGPDSRRERQGADVVRPSPLLEGIWRVNAGGDSPVREEQVEATSGEAEPRTFTEFARRRRALTRERELTGGGGGNGGTELSSSSMSTGASTNASTDQATPEASNFVSSVTTPATSHAPSPISTCPPNPTARPVTSADRAVAAMRRQREIAPLPSGATSNPQETEESRARFRAEWERALAES